MVLNLDYLQIGKTKVFLRTGQMAELDSRRAGKLNNAAKTIQRKTRTHIARQHFLALHKASVDIQALWRSMPLGIPDNFIAFRCHICICATFYDSHLACTFYFHIPRKTGLQSF